MVSRLSFVPGESEYHGLHYWEPAVDGRLLRHVLSDDPRNALADTVVGPNVPVLVHSWPVGMTDDVLVLLGEKSSELTSGRVPIWICAACGDLGCGAVTAAVERDADTVVWSAFGWDTNSEADWEEDDEAPLEVGPFVFDRAQYEAELRRFVDTFDDVRAALPPHLRQPLELPPKRTTRWWWPFG